MKTKLITYLRLAATALENGTFRYEWSRPESCNCGVLACAIMGKGIGQMKQILQKQASSGTEPRFANWMDIVGYNCPITGIPEHEVLKAMFEVGMTAKDIQELELLSNEKVKERAKIDGWRQSIQTNPNWFSRVFLGKKPEKKDIPIEHPYRKAKIAADYMRHWADILAEEGREDGVRSPTPKEKETA